MQLLNAIQDLKALHTTAQESLTQAQEALSEANVRSVLKASFAKEVANLTRDLSAEAEEILSQKATELDKNNANTLNALFNENLESLAETTARKLPLNVLSEKVTRKFLKEHENNLKVFLNEALSNAPYEETLKSAQKEVKEATNSFLEKIPSQETITEITKSLIYEYLEKNEEKILKQIDFRFIESATLEFIENNTELHDFIEKEAIELLKQRVSFLSVRKEIKSLLQTEANAVFETALGYQELIQKRFQASLQIAAFHLLGELGSLSKILNAITDTTIAENRLNTLIQTGKDEREPRNRIFKVI